ncbi:polyprenyl synthetase family protein [Bacteroidota bacterium]|nr:polyprenyl synthetase family protein [Bacteroidota bacterium]
MPIFEEQNLTEFLAEVKLNMENITDSHEEDIQEINDYIFQSSGKFIRSKLIFIYGTFLEVDRNDLVELSSATELIHLSTLIHDDIIDDAPIRRGKKTIFKKWGVTKALLYGDYLYTKTFSSLNSLQNQKIASILIQCAEKLIEGEFKQLKNIGNLNVSISDYQIVINNKTAVLFSGILESIAIYAKLEKHQVMILKDLGQEFGYAFQLNDDLSDFVNAESGKKTFKDLSENKYTFPLIVVLNNSVASKKEKIIKLIHAGDYQSVKKEIEKDDGFKKTRSERDKAIQNCIKMTKKLLADENLKYAENFLISTLKS